MIILRLIPPPDVAIELGGEDSKILFLTNGEDLRMNSSCTGGTGDFIDIIAAMLNSNAEELSRFALGYAQFIQLPHVVQCMRKVMLGH